MDNNNGNGFDFGGNDNYNNDFGDGFLGDSSGQNDNDGGFLGSTYGSQPDNFNSVNSTQNGYSGNTYGSQPNDFNSMNGTQNGYSGNTYGSQPNDFNSMNGTQNGYSRNTYGSQPDNFNSIGGTQNDFSGNSFNSTNSTESGYDPNAMFSDPSSSMYGNSGYNPNSPYSSFNTQTQYSTVTKSSISKYIPVIAIILAVAVGIGVFFYVKNAGQKTIKEWLDTPEGKSAVNEMYQAGLNGSNFSEDEVKVFARGDDELVFLFTINDTTYIPQEEADALQKYMDQAIASRRSLISNEIKKLRNGYKIKPFSIVYEMVTASDQIMFSVKITE